MQVHGLPDQLQVGRVEMHQTPGPIRTQRTVVQQRAGVPLVFDKEMQRGLEVGAGQWLMVCQIRASISELRAADFLAWRNETREAVGILATVLDERIAEEELFEDVILLRDAQPVAPADLRERIRHFLPYQVTDTERENLTALSEASLGDVPGSVRNALRWYLRGAHAGPTHDGFLFLWLALEGLVPGWRNSAKEIEWALQDAGWEEAHQRLAVRTLVGLRGRLVHSADADAAQLADGFYDAETMVRVLLRARLGLSSSWPAPVGLPTFEPPFDEQIGGAWENPAVEWHADDMAIADASPIHGLAWDVLDPPPPLATEIVVESVSNEQRVHVRRWVRVALAVLGEEPERVLIKVRRARHEGDIVTTVDDEAITIDSRLLKDLDRLTSADPIRVLHLGLHLCALVADHLLQKDRVLNTTPVGVIFVGVLAGFIQHQLFVDGGPFEEAELELQPLSRNSPLLPVGQHTGLTLAGNTRSRKILETWLEGDGISEELRGLIRALVRDLHGFSDASAVRHRLAKLYIEMMAEPPAG
jgi:hypothetical protein